MLQAAVVVAPQLVVPAAADGPCLALVLQPGKEVAGCRPGEVGGWDTARAVVDAVGAGVGEYTAVVPGIAVDTDGGIPEELADEELGNLSSLCDRQVALAQEVTSDLARDTAAVDAAALVAVVCDL